jgi:hypothetical protein
MMGRPSDANPAAFFVTAKKLFDYRDSHPAPVNSSRKTAENCG